MNTLYDKDILLWTEQQIELLQQHRWDELDTAHLIEELESLGKSEERAIASHMENLIAHLLKLEYWFEARKDNEAGWQQTVRRIRKIDIPKLLEDTPSLKRYLNDSQWLAKQYRRAVRAVEDDIPRNLPLECPYSVEQSLDLEWLPAHRVPNS